MPINEKGFIPNLLNSLAVYGSRAIYRRILQKIVGILVSSREKRTEMITSISAAFD